MLGLFLWANTMSMTTDRNDPDLNNVDPVTGLQRAYLVLSEDERAKGFVRPYRDEYTHQSCGTRTIMGKALAETYARDPKFYGGTFCCGCKTHFLVGEFKWNDGTVVGS